MPTPPTHEEIVRAHDLLCPVLHGEIQLPLYPDSEIALKASHDAIAWVLGYDEGIAFEHACAVIEAAARQRGYELVDSGKVQER